MAVFCSLVLLCVLVLIFAPSLPVAGGRLGRLPAGPVRPVVACGANHAVILAADGSLWTWGEAGFGWQILGLGSNVRTQSYLAQIGSETSWIDVAVGGSTTLALKADGTIWGWGENIYGQLGDGTAAPDRPAPVRSVAGNDWKQVAVAGPHSVALKKDGSLWSWGNNWAGQLGDGTTNNSRVPVRVGTFTNWTRIWANLIQNVGQQSDGSLWFWGWDYTPSQQGQSIPVPTRVSLDTNWVDVGMGDWMVFAVKSDGTLWAWGRSANVYTGITNSTLNAIPMQVGSDRDWVACSCFAQSAPLFMKRDGSLWVLDGSPPKGVAAVTWIVSGLVTNGQLNFVVNGTTLQCDPAFGVVKELQITFQLGGTTNTLSFRENSAVHLGGPGERLVITKALYGDPKLIRMANLDPLPPQFQWPRLRQIKVPKPVVAFGGGRHRFGAALTSDGEVWTWGEALGQHKPANAMAQLFSGLLKLVGIKNSLGDPQPMVFEEPIRLPMSDQSKSANLPKGTNPWN